MVMLVEGRDIDWSSIYVAAWLGRNLGISTFEDKEGASISSFQAWFSKKSSIALVRPTLEDS